MEEEEYYGDVHNETSVSSFLLFKEAASAVTSSWQEDAGRWRLVSGPVGSEGTQWLK